MGNSSADISVLMGIADLAKRCGMRPGEACAWIDTDEDARGFDKACRVSFSLARDPDHDPGMKQFCDLLGLGDKDILYAPDVEDIQEIVDKALSLAPRMRQR